MSLVGHELAQAVIARALSRGGDLGELYAEDRHGFSLTLDDGRIERPQGGTERGASVRVVKGEASYFGHVDGLGEAELLEVADSVAQAVRGGSREVSALDAPAARRRASDCPSPRGGARNRQGGAAALLRRARPGLRR